MGGLKKAPTKNEYANSEQGKAVKAKLDAGDELSYDESLTAKLSGFDTTKKPASTMVPTLFDQGAQAAKMTQALQLLSGRGRRASMANGEYGDSMLGGF